MKKVFILLGLFVGVCCSHAQQKEKQIKVLLEQISANKVYIEYLQKGYKIAHEGLQTIGDIKKGDFNLHLQFFDSLKKVNSAIKGAAKVADIVTYQLRIIKVITQTINASKVSKQFTDEELSYCKSVFDNLLNECLKDIDELVTIVTDGKATMRDDERMKHIDKLYDDMQDKYSFSSSFSEEMGILSAQRLSEQNEIDLSKKINGITPNP